MLEGICFYIVIRFLQFDRRLNLFDLKILRIV